MELKSIVKTCRIFDLVASHPDGLRLSALADQMGLPRNSVLNILQTLVGCGYLQKTESGAYRPGPRLVQLGRLAVTSQPELRNRIEDILQELASSTGELTVWCGLAGGERVQWLRIEGGGSVRVHEEPPSSTSLYDLPTGRVLLAWSGEDERRRIAGREKPGKVWKEADERGVEEACAALRRQGHCVIERKDREVVSLAVPVLIEGAIHSTIGCSVPRYRCDRKRRRVLLGQMKGTAERIGEQLRAEEIGVG